MERFYQTLIHSLHTRRFWLAVVSAVLLVLTQGMGLKIDTTTVLAFAGMIISAIFGDAIAEAAHARAQAVVASEQAHNQTTNDIMQRGVGALVEVVQRMPGSPLADAPAAPKEAPHA